MSTVAKTLTEARKHLGYYKKPGTVTKFGDWYAKQVGSNVYRTAQWCAIFISYVASSAGASKIIPLHAYTPSGVNWFKAQKRWHNGLAGVRAGDIVYFNFGSLGRVSHIGIVESVNRDGSVNTIEGNTSSTAAGDQRNSGTCARKRRKAYIVGYGRPNYAASAATGGVTKSISTLATEVLAGKHGNGDTRKKSLGSQYAAVQAEVSKRLTSKTPAKQPAKSAPSKPATTRLQTGDKGKSVKALQVRLNRDYPAYSKLDPDGVFGGRTDGVVREFQRRAGLTVDGIAGPDTLEKLGLT